MTKKSALMIVCTYNEARNIEKLLAELFGMKEIAKAGWQLDVLVMDDYSPDGTGEIVEKLAAGKYKGRLFLRRGKKQGLGVAIQRSFDEALKLGHEVIMTMDADFSHAPRDVINLLQGIDSGADVAIGSRYVDGGFIPGNWPLPLIIRTRTATHVARWLGGISNDIHELTTNFRAVRRHVLETINYNSASASGYGIQIFLANAFTSHDFKVVEVPITFHSRAEGSSKARLKDTLEFFKIAYNLNPDSPGKQVLRFVAVGLSGTIINLGALWLLDRLLETRDPIISFGAIQLSILWNFTLHNLFTFKAYRKAVGRPLSRLGMTLRNLIRYEGAALLTQLVILGVYSLLSWFGLYFVLAQLVGIASAFLINYYISSTYIWSVARTYAR